MVTPSEPMPTGLQVVFIVWEIAARCGGGLSRSEESSEQESVATAYEDETGFARQKFGDTESRS